NHFNGVSGINARDVHRFLKVGRDYSTWIRARIKQAGFIENQDFLIVENLSSPELASTNNKQLSTMARPQKLIDYIVSLDMAKHLCLMEKNEIGRAIRQHFIEAEKQLRTSSPAIYKNTLSKTIERLESIDRNKEMTDAIKAQFGKLLTALIAPPLNTFVLLIIAAIIYCVHFKKLAKFIALISFTWLYIMSAPFTGLLLTDNDDIPALTLDEYKQAQAIVILGGGSYPTKELYAETASGAPQLERLRYAAFLQKETGLPILTTGYSLIGISEGDLMAKELNQFFNVPTQWIENKARNTEENASFTKNI
ncbi:conserved hypothetical protein, partial [Haemophilus influenzae HK1212]